MVTATMNDKSIVCPFCGGTEFVEAHAASIANISKNPAFSLKKATIIYQVCLACGTIIRSYVKNPEDLL